MSYVKYFILLMFKFLKSRQNQVNCNEEKLSDNRKMDKQRNQDMEKMVTGRIEKVILTRQRDKEKKIIK